MRRAIIILSACLLVLLGCDKDGNKGGNQFTGGWWERETQDNSRSTYLVFDFGDQVNCISSYFIVPEKIDYSSIIFLDNFNIKENSLHFKETSYVIEDKKLTITHPNSITTTFVKSVPPNTLQDRHKKSLADLTKGEKPLTDVDGKQILRINFDKNNKIHVEPLEKIQPFIGDKKLTIIHLTESRGVEIFSLSDGEKIEGNFKLIRFIDDSIMYRCIISENDGLLKLSKRHTQDDESQMKHIATIKLR